MKFPIEIDTTPGPPITWPDGTLMTRRDIVVIAVQWIGSVAFVAAMIGLTLANTPAAR